MKGRQGGTRFDCPKLKKKSRKSKVRDTFFSELAPFLGGTEGTVVFSATRRTQWCVQNLETKFLSKTSTQARQEQLNGLIKAQ